MITIASSRTTVSAGRVLFGSDSLFFTKTPEVLPPDTSVMFCRLDIVASVSEGEGVRLSPTISTRFYYLAASCYFGSFRPGIAIICSMRSPLDGED